MATVIKPKRSETGSSVPTSSDLEVGEFAVNTADKTSSILEIWHGQRSGDNGWD